MQLPVRRSTIVAASTLAFVLGCAALWLLCSPPAPPDVPGEEDLVMEIQLDTTGMGVIEVGDTIGVTLPLYPAYQIDSVYLSLRQACAGVVSVLDSAVDPAGWRDTVRAGIRLTCPDTAAVILRMVMSSGNAYLDTIKILVADTSQTVSGGCTWKSDTVRAAISDTGRLQIVLEDSLICTDSAVAHLTLLAGGPANDSIDTAGAYHFDPSAADTGVVLARVAVDAGTGRDTVILRIAVTAHGVPGDSTIAVSWQRSDSGHVRLSWNRVENAAFYVVWRSSVRGSGYGQITTVTDTFHVDATASDFYYYVNARNAGGFSVFSDTVYTGTVGCAWKSAAMSASILEGETLMVDLPDSLHCGGGASGQLLLMSGGPAADLIDSNSTYRFPSTYRDAGRDTARVIVFDGTSRDTMAIFISVTNVNLSPVFSNDPFSMNIAWGTTATSPVALAAVDSIDNDSLSYGILDDSTNLPAGVTAALDSTCHLRITANAGVDTGDYRVVVTVNDGHGGRDTLTVSVVIYDPTAADRLGPTITPGAGNPANRDTVNDSVLELSFTIEDPSRIHHAVFVDARDPSDSTPVVVDDSGNCGFSWLLTEGPDSLRLIAYDSSTARNRSVYSYSVTYLIPPTIVTQPPASVSVIEPARVKVSITARGSAPITYQWYRSSTVVGTSDSLVFDPSAVSNSGTYYCEVTNSQGSARSTNVTISVATAPKKPQILTNPRDTRVVKGDAAAFTVTINADAYPAPVFRWYQTGSNTVIDSSGATLTVTGTTYAHEGREYYAIVSNSQGSDTSDTAVLSIEDVTRPAITITGPSDTTILLNGTYADPGATASDDRDGNISSRISAVSTVNLTAPGRYTVTYNVMDADSNAAVTKVRNVVVEGWVEIGTRFPVNEYSMTLSPDGVPYIAYTDDNDSGAAKVVKLQGNSWVRVGGLASEKDAQLPVIRFSHKEVPPTAYLAVDNRSWCDTNGCEFATQVYRNQGSTWSGVGYGGLGDGGVFDRNQFLDMTITADDSIFVVSYGKVFKYQSYSWELAADSNSGLKFMAFNGRGSSIAYLPDGRLYLAGVDTATAGGYTGVRLRVGEQWQPLATPGERARGPYPDMRASAANDLYIMTGSGDSPWDPTVRRFNGTSWDSIFCPVRGGDFSLTVASDNRPVVACIDWDDQYRLRVWRQTASGWSTVPSFTNVPVLQDEADETTVLEHQGTLYVAVKTRSTSEIALMRYAAP